MDEQDQIRVDEAYRAMLRFLEDYYARGGSDELAILLGGAVIGDDGAPMDPAMWSDWVSAVQATIADRQ